MLPELRHLWVKIILESTRPSCGKYYPFLRYSVKSSSKEENSQQFSMKYSKNDSDKIIEIVNGCTKEDLLRYNLTQGRASRIDQYKLKHGPFKTLDEILNVEGFGVKILEKLGDNILKPSLSAQEVIPVKSKRMRSETFTTPPVAESIRSSCKSILSLNIGVASMSWTRFEYNDEFSYQVTHWDFHEMLEKRLSLSDLVKRCLYLDHFIPEADCYVLEAPQTAQTPTSPGNAELININVQKAQMIGIMSFAFVKRNGAEENLFYLKRYLPARLFRLLVGTEKTSTEETVLNLMRTHYNVNDIVSPTPEDRKTGLMASDNIIVPLELRQTFNDAKNYQREFLGRSFLTGLTFLKLCIVKCPNSIQTILKPSKES